MIFITEEKEISHNNIVVLYFYASWMPFHKKMITMISKMENKYSNIKFYAIDTDYFKSLCNIYKVKSIPEIIINKDGKEIKRANGLIMTSAFKSLFADIC